MKPKGSKPPAQEFECPEWVPSWVLSSPNEDVLEFRGAREVLSSPQCAIVWPAIEKRRRYKGAMVRSLFGHVERALEFTDTEKLSSTGRKIYAKNVIDAINLVCDAHRKDLISLHWTNSTREKIVECLTPHLARALTGTLSLKAIPAGEVIDRIRAGELTVGDVLADEVSCDADTLRDARTRAESVEMDLGVLAFSEFEEMLQRAAHWVSKWAGETPTVRRGNNRNAPRTYFIRSISKFFFTHCGDPLREQTLAIASIFFDCSNMTAADVNKLAPRRALQWRQ